MNDIEIDWILWLTTMAPLAFSAGPGNIMVATSGARSGLRRSMLFIYGLDGSYFLIAIAVGFGLGEILRLHPIISDAVKVIGISYILLLAWRFWRADPPGDVDSNDPFRFKDGVIVQLSNAKGIIMLATMFSQFLMPSASITANVLTMSAALVLLNFLAHLMWATFGLVINEALRRDVRFLRAQNGIFAAMMLSVGIWLALR